VAGNDVISFHNEGKVHVLDGRRGAREPTSTIPMTQKEPGPQRPAKQSDLATLNTSVSSRQQLEKEVHSYPILGSFDST
jgi:hypothetical protein